VSRSVAVEEAQARAAYEAHCGFTGAPKRWEQLTEQERCAWYVAAGAVLSPPETEATPRRIDHAEPGRVKRFDDDEGS
jgi:hypothetical protein